MKTKMQLLQDELDNDPFEQEIIKAAQKEYYKTKRKEKRHRVDTYYNGEANEKLFRDYIDYLYESIGCIQYYKWLSYHEKSEYDFRIQLKDGSLLFIDVVGTHTPINTLKLNCSHKDYKPKLKELLTHRFIAHGYLAFILDGKWRFLQISRHLPKGDISMSPNRRKHVKKPSFLFKCDSLPDNCPEKAKNSFSKCARNEVIESHSIPILW